MSENWKDIDGYQGKYQVSDLGRIRILRRRIFDKNGKKREYPERIVFPTEKGNGYHTVSLCLNGRIKSKLVHRLVAKAFLKEDSARPYVNHKNCDKKDNRISNLEWCTPKENVLHARKLGRVGGRKARPVNQICKNTGSIVRSFNSMSDVKKYGFHADHVRQVCNGERKTHGNYRWEFK